MQSVESKNKKESGRKQTNGKRINFFIILGRIAFLYVILEHSLYDSREMSLNYYDLKCTVIFTSIFIISNNIKEKQKKSLKKK